MSKSNDKTNVMRLLESKKLSYNEYTYPSDTIISGIDVANYLNQDPTHVFKTLVTIGKTGNHYVFVIPVAEELDFKKAAISVGEKSIEMIKSKDLLGLTGYIHGGCSPIGMKKNFITTIHITARDLPEIIFSGGRVGYQVETSLDNLSKIIKFGLSDIIK